MAWVRLDDKFPEHPKVLAAGDVAAWLHVCALAYSNRHETDGFVPDLALKTLTSRRRSQELADTLVRVGLWDKVDNGYLIHDYLEYQPSRSQREAERTKARERMANNRRSSGEHDPNIAGSSPEVRLTPTRPDPTRIHNSCTETDDLRDVAKSSSPVDIALKVAARAAYLANPQACKGSPERYIDGIERTMRLERMIEATELAAKGKHPVDIADQLNEHIPTHTLAAARHLGITPPPPIPKPPPCTVCDNTGWITDDPDQRTVTHCPDCTPHNATA